MLLDQKCFTTSNQFMVVNQNIISEVVSNIRYVLSTNASNRKRVCLFNSLIKNSYEEFYKSKDVTFEACKIASNDHNEIYLVFVKNPPKDNRTKIIRSKGTTLIIINSEDITEMNLEEFITYVYKVVCITSNYLCEYLLDTNDISSTILKGFVTWVTADICCSNYETTSYKDLARAHYMPSAAKIEKIFNLDLSDILYNDAARPILKGWDINE